MPVRVGGEELVLRNSVVIENAPYLLGDSNAPEVPVRAFMACQPPVRAFMSCQPVPVRAFMSCQPGAKV